MRTRTFPFIKMTGSGNDFVFFDGRLVDSEDLAQPQMISTICNRHNGIGADGIVILEPAPHANAGADGPSGPVGDAIVRYYNSDGSPADLCGNATLCSTRLALQSGFQTVSSEAAINLVTPAGVIAGRLPLGGDPEIDLPPVHDVRSTVAIPLGPGERRIGFAVAGIPHLVVLCDDAERIDVEGRGPGLRRHPAVGAAGANVNWVSPLEGGGWRYRTFERGVEGETLACGTGAVAVAVLLAAWDMTAGPARIRTGVGRDLTVRFRHPADVTAKTSIQLAEPATEWLPSLCGEGRIVFRGTIEL